MRIVSLKASNVKRLVAVHIEPDPEGNLVVISGENGAGKSSVLDAVAYALGGKDLICEEPLRRGAKRGSIEVDLGDMKVKRTFTRTGGGRLEVTPKDGGPMRQPQTLLDTLMGRISFDPLAFSRMKPKQQRETLADLVGLDTTTLDTERQEVYDARTEVNRELHRLEGVLSEVERDDEAPIELVDVAWLVSELREADAQQAEIQRLKDSAIVAKQKATEAHTDSESKQREIERLQDRIDELTQQATDAIDRAEDQEELAAGLLQEVDGLSAKAVDREGLKSKLEAAEDINARVRANKQYDDLAAQIAVQNEAGAKLTGRLKDLDEQKLQQIADANYPIDGLELDEDGVIFDDLPLSQASSAEQLRISVAIGIAMNPKLRVLLIRDGSLLDGNNLALIGKMAEDSDSQVFIERVEQDDATSVVIEAGRVQGAAGEESDDKSQPGE
jgi:DNA repair exonuclease SbcCD ATPase subunit